MYKEIRIDLSTAVVEHKYCFRVSLPSDYLKISLESKILNTLVYLDGEILSVSDSQHQEIREIGDGRYSIWYSDLYFSTPQNKSLFEFKFLVIRVVDESIATILQNNYCKFFGTTNSNLLDILKINKTTNNSFINNYFSSFNSFLSHSLEYLSMENVKKMFIIGCGAEPYVAIRFIAEGIRDIYVNDILKIKSVYSEIEKNTILDLIDIFSSQKRELVSNSFIKVSETEFKINNIRIFDEINFENLSSLDNFDLTFSNSVLEHVHNVKDVYSQISKITKVGGYAYHTIDLRDHLNYFRPLEFLKLSKNDYLKINTENRLRSIDHLNYFKKNSFEILTVKYHFIKRSEFENLSSFIKETDNCDKYLEVPEILSDIDRSQLHPDFQKYDLRELSIIGISILARKYE
jgi:SAM-dependent methyltransferase